MINYRKYRWFFTASGKLVVGGKSAVQNDELIHESKSLHEDHIVMHTSDPGSPFCVMLAPIAQVSTEDLDECAVFTGCFSRAWREGKQKTSVDIFRLSQLHKDKSMKDGTWGVFGNVQQVSVPLELALTKQENIIRAVPKKTLKQSKANIIIHPGTIDKLDMLAKLEIELNEPLSQDEVLAALPAGGLKVSHQ